MNKFIFPVLSVVVVATVLGAYISVAVAQSTNIFTRDLSIGMNGDDIGVLQRFLNSHSAQVSTSGPGSPGNETNYFGERTRAATALWQKIVGVSPSVGYFGPKSRARMNSLTEELAQGEKPSSLLSSSSSMSSISNGSLPADFLSIEAFSESALIATDRSLSGLPIRLSISRINIDSAIEHLGLTTEGAIDAPKGPVNTAWFNLSPRPGEIGTAVISGHFGWKDDIPAVFDNLHKLTKGDNLSIKDEKGVITVFVVRELRTYGENDNASEVFGSSDGRAHLNLITCQGIWSKTKKSYPNRLVVFTDKVETTQ